MPTHSSKTTTNHSQIQRWAQARHAQPAHVKGTGGQNDPGMIRLDFPGYSGRTKLAPISWDEWFKAFDDNNLALVYQEKTASGQRSNFNKLVSRSTAADRKRSEGGTARRSTRKSTGRSTKTRRSAAGSSSRRTTSRSSSRRRG
jgi:hypothetical protein